MEQAVSEKARRDALAEASEAVRSKLGVTSRALTIIARLAAPTEEDNRG